MQAGPHRLCKCIVGQKMFAVLGIHGGVRPLKSPYVNESWMLNDINF